MKIFKKIFLSGIIFLVILFLQVIFSEKNFAKDFEKDSYNFLSCIHDFENEMEKLASENRYAYNKNIKKICEDWDEICLTLSEKWDIITYNFRILVKNLEWICDWLQSFIFTKKIEKNNKNKIWFDNKIFKHCNTDSSTQWPELINICENKKDRILYWDWKDWTLNWDSWEYWWIQDNFKNDAKKDKVNFLAARIYDLNVKMRELVWNMTELRIKIVDIVNRLVCTEK